VFFLVSLVQIHGNMGIEARKLTIIEQFITIQNTDIISQFENLLKKFNKTDLSLKPFTAEELNTRIDKSMKSASNEELISNTELIKEIQKWK